MTDHTNASRNKNTVAQSPAGDAYLPSFAEWVTRTGNRGRGRAPLSVEAHLQDMRVFSRWFTATTRQEFKPELITSADLRAFHHESVNIQHAAPKTWNRRRVSLALFCEWAIEAKLINYSPFQGVPFEEEVEEAPHWLNQSDYARFMRMAEQATNAANTDLRRKNAVRNQAMAAVMVYCGLRVGEVAELTTSDLLLTDRTGEIRVRHGKGRKSRSIPLGREARYRVNAWLEVAGLQGNNPLFGGITTRQIERVVKEIGRGAEVSVTPHQLRHTMLKRFLDGNGNNPNALEMAQKIAGHSRLETTLIYTRSGMEDRAAALENQH